MAIKDDFSVYQSLIVEELERRKKAEEEMENKRRENERITKRTSAREAEISFRKKLVEYFIDMPDDVWKKSLQEYEKSGLGEVARNCRVKALLKSRYREACEKGEENGFLLCLTDEQVSDLMYGMPFIDVIRINQIRNKNSNNN